MIERQKICEACEHQVMKAGFHFPRCRYPENDFRLGPENIDDPGRACPAGLWPQTRFQDKRAVQAKLAAQGAMTTEYNRRMKICDACTEIMANGKPCALGKGCPACRRRGLYKPNMACPADPPRWGPVNPNAPAEQEPPPAGKRTRVIWTISAWNEDLLSDTVRELYDSITDPHIDFDVLVIDDGSTNGCAKALPCKVLTNPEPLGIGYNLNLAAEYAIAEMGADVVGVADAHMRIPKGSVGALARRAMQETCVVCSHSRGYEPTSSTRGMGAYLCIKREDCVAAKWIGDKWPRLPDLDRPGNTLHRPEAEWAQVQVPLGAFYAYSAATVRALSAPTGRLWETVVGRWGFLLEPFSLKCLLMNIPVYVSRDVWAGHLYRSANPCPRSHIEKVYNGAFGFASVLSEDTFENYTREKFGGFHKWALTRGNIDKRTVDEKVLAGRVGVKRPWTPAREREILDSLPILDHENGKDEANPIALDAIMLPTPRK